MIGDIPGRIGFWHINGQQGMGRQICRVAKLLQISAQGQNGLLLLLHKLQQFILGQLMQGLCI
jgi:hypothetical protein